ncbi:MAG: argininosuccinate lyase [Pseudomonadota bacterium]|jgi:hypothetical protein|uniref:Uncharacterized protein n=1 Tax=Pseudooceanicola nitratireducens TaxID=517719 RepID=A0A1I1IV67_9RHOB|nr:argininosuccinate lyase [Pseudooceanicola nitratireducens]MEC7300583.1 argininosuccinate lyase [Pseudomonadota bacterium]MBY6164745.1 argininosuccinate lyase [Pseudooceanicola nitratireducens]MEC7794511.1 argininosuccinate lyase [Pseudomonadota bacterium]MEC8666302.1 argininosuccinate lyase [Pseudomonadota bacterium]SEJ24525.1 hypothetical protein SAMN05216183_102713 [Pseudooceanicola nitratireducens]
MTRLLPLALLLALTACGVDGEPEQPEPAPKPGLSVSGRAAVGVTF